MQRASKRKPILIAVRVLVITFVMGNTIAWLSGAKPIDFPVLPYAPSDLAAVTQLESTSAADMPSENAQSLGMSYFLHNHLDEAHQVIQSALSKDEHDVSLFALNAANEVKRAGKRLDLLFGQVKLYELKTALSTLKSVSDAQPEQLDIQLLALWAFTSVPDISDSAQNAIVVAKRIEPILNAGGALPEALSASSWLALTRLYLYLAESEAGTPAAVAWRGQARDAWQQYQGVNARPIWLEQEHAVVEQTIAGLPDAKT